MVAASPMPVLFAAAVDAIASTLPPGYAYGPGGDCTGRETGTEGDDRAQCRWLAPASPGPAAPLLVELAVTSYCRRTAALCALTSRPVLPVGAVVRPLFPPRIGSEAIAVRGDIVDGGGRFVLYRIDVLVNHAVLSLAGGWRWPAGSPDWIYERARLLATLPAALDRNLNAR